MHKVKSSSTYSYRFKVGKFLPLIILQCNLQSKKKKKSSHFCINLKTSNRSDIGSRASFCSTAELFTVARRTTNIRQPTQQVKTICVRVGIIQSSVNSYHFLRVSTQNTELGRHWAMRKMGKQSNNLSKTVSQDRHCFEPFFF